MKEEERELQPCPFCGETRHLVTVGSSDVDGVTRWAVHCQSWEGEGCLCHGPVAKTEKEAARLWNERAVLRLAHEKDNRVTLVPLDGAPPEEWLPEE